MGGASVVRLASTALWSSTALASCFSDRGLAIEIDVGDTGAKSVELFIGKLACSSDSALDCKAIAPPPTSPMASTPLRGDIWFRDDISLETAKVKGRTATFQLRSDRPHTIPTLIAVGLLDPDGPTTTTNAAVATATLHDVDVPVNTARVVTATLVAANPVQPGAAIARNATEDRVMVWGKAMPQSACVVVEHWEGGAATRTFVVPREDPDCDDVVPECNPMAWHGSAAAGGAARPDCFSSQSGSACALGSYACSDDFGPEGGECKPTRSMVCVPKELCSCNPNAIDPGCFQGLFPLPAIPFVRCRIPMVMPMLGPCPGWSSTISLEPHFAHDATCGEPLITSLAAMDFEPSSTFGGAKLEALDLQSPCSFSLAWKTGTRANPFDPGDLGAVKVLTRSGAIAIPLAIQFNAVALSECPAAPVDCELIESVQPDPVWDCAL